MESCEQQNGGFCLHPFHYKDFGILVPLHELNAIEKTIHKLDTEQQAKYVDAIVQRYATRIEFLDKYFNNLEKLKQDADSLNGNSFGNLAFIALNSPEPYRSNASDFLKWARIHVNH